MLGRRTVALALALAVSACAGPSGDGAGASTPTTPVSTATPTTATPTIATPTTATPTTTTTPTTTPYVVPVADVGVAGWSPTHSGYPATDIFISCGAEVVSPVNGTVIEARTADRWDPAVDNPATRGGRSVAVLGDDGVRYYVAHLDTNTTAPGQRVVAGEAIATVGRTGRTSACHVHFAISPPCSGPEWSIRRGVIWPYRYLDAWKTGDQLSPVGEVDQWQLDHPGRCAAAMADPFAVDAA